jgi:hypothetical protein
MNHFGVLSEPGLREKLQNQKSWQNLLQGISGLHLNLGRTSCTFLFYAFCFQKIAPDTQSPELTLLV